VNIFLLSSISDATLMLDFCEVQHLKLNLSAALVASAEAKSPIRRSFWFFFLRLHSQEKERKQISHINKRGSCLDR
jgi:hypothetical protein